MRTQSCLSLVSFDTFAWVDSTLGISTSFSRKWSARKDVRDVIRETNMITIELGNTVGRWCAWPNGVTAGYQVLLGQVLGELGWLARRSMSAQHQASLDVACRERPRPRSPQLDISWRVPGRDQCATSTSLRLLTPRQTIKLGPRSPRHQRMWSRGG